MCCWLFHSIQTTACSKWINMLFPVFKSAPSHLLAFGYVGLSGLREPLAKTAYRVFLKYPDGSEKPQQKPGFKTGKEAKKGKREDHRRII